MPSRREFLEGLALPALALSLPAPRAQTARGFVDLRRPPDSVMAQTATGDIPLTPGSGDTWTGANGIAVTTTVRGDAISVRLSAPSTPIKRIRLRWRGDLSSTRQILGDAWERGYGDLEWRGWIPDRVMPWYVATSDGAATHAYGVRTGANARFASGRSIHRDSALGRCPQRRRGC